MQSTTRARLTDPQYLPVAQACHEAFRDMFPGRRANTSAWAFISDHSRGGWLLTAIALSDAIVTTSDPDQVAPAAYDTWRQQVGSRRDVLDPWDDLDDDTRAQWLRFAQIALAAEPFLVAYQVTSDLGVRTWMADDADHARAQHLDAFPDEAVLAVAVAA